MAQLEDKINTTLDQVISTEWTGKSRGEVAGSLKKKSRGSGALKGNGRQIRRASKGGGKGGNAGGGKGKDSSMPRGPRAKGFVKKTLFSKKRGTTAASRTSLKVWSKGAGKGTVKGKSKGSRRRLAKGKGKGKCLRAISVHLAQVARGSGEEPARKARVKGRARTPVANGKGQEKAEAANGKTKAKAKAGSRAKAKAKAVATSSPPMVTECAIAL